MFTLLQQRGRQRAFFPSLSLSGFTSDSDTKPGLLFETEMPGQTTDFSQNFPLDNPGWYFKNSCCFKMDGTERQKKGDILVTVGVVCWSCKIRGGG